MLVLTVVAFPHAPIQLVILTKALAQPQEFNSGSATLLESPVIPYTESSVRLRQDSNGEVAGEFGSDGRSILDTVRVQGGDYERRTGRVGGRARGKKYGF